MKAILPFVLVTILGAVGSQEVGDVSPSQRSSMLLQEAVRNLINYTAMEVEARLDMNDIGSTVAAIAYQKVTKKLGKYMYSAILIAFTY